MNKQNILITGCSIGSIGHATASYLKDEGHNVFLTVRSQAELENLKEQGFGNVYILDVNDYDAVDKILSGMLEITSGKIDVLFNNAGYGQAGALEDLDTKLLREQFETNVFALHNLSIAVIPVMRKQGYGKIIQHSSVLGLISMKYKGAYNSSKYAVEGIADTLRLELEGSGVSVVTLNTGPVTSNFRANSLKTVVNIDVDNSIHKPQYEQILAGNHKKVPFNLEAIELAKIVSKILKTDKPSPRYYITKATWIMAVLKRLLPSYLLDKILIKY